jgi:hypothetical protein
MTRVGFDVNAKVAAASSRASGSRGTSGTGHLPKLIVIPRLRQRRVNDDLIKFALR